MFTLGDMQVLQTNLTKPTKHFLGGKTKQRKAPRRNRTKYTYDGNLKRVKTVQDGKTTYWVYSRLTGTPLYADEETDAKQTSYITAGGATVRLASSGEEYTHLDHQGSPIAATNAAGTLLWREHYNPFGEKREDPPSNRNDVGYTGHVQDDNTDLTYMQARYYDPVIGRFLSTDPIGYEDQMNLYAYVGNDPVNAFDPNGEAASLVVRGTCTLSQQAGKRAVVPALNWIITRATAGAALSLGDLIYQAVNDESDDGESEDADEETPKYTDVEGNRPPFVGEPGSTVRGGTGSRTYGEDGHPDEKGPGRDDHAHDWGRPEKGPPTHKDRQPARPPKANDPPRPRGPNVPPPEKEYWE